MILYEMRTKEKIMICFEIIKQMVFDEEITQILDDENLFDDIHQHDDLILKIFLKILDEVNHIHILLDEVDLILKIFFDEIQNELKISKIMKKILI